MSAWTRWQDWAAVAFGVLAYLAPFVLDEEPGSPAAWTAILMGTALIVGGLSSGSMPEPSVEAEWVPLIVGSLLFVAPWPLGLASTTPIAWAAWILGGLAIVTGASELLLPGGLRIADHTRR